MKALGDYVHSKGLSFAIYSAESTETCGGYPASANHEEIDANTFASWGVDYIKGACKGAYYYLCVNAMHNLYPSPTPLTYTFLQSQWMGVETMDTTHMAMQPWVQP